MHSSVLLKKIKSKSCDPNNPAQNLLKLHQFSELFSNNYFQAAVTTVGIAVRPPVPQVDKVKSIQQKNA